MKIKIKKQKMSITEKTKNQDVAISFQTKTDNSSIVFEEYECIYLFLS
jgi:hypothetical protein